MEIEIVYPPRKRFAYPRAVTLIKWVFVSAAYVCSIVNLAVGGKPWSVVVLWALWSVWSLAVSRDLVEYNRVSQTVKLLVHTCVLLVLIDLCLSSGWAGFVVPIVSFATLFMVGVLFFSDLSRQKQNLMPMIWLIGASLIAMIVSLAGWPGMNWPMLLLGITAFTMLAVSVIVLKRDLLRELRKRFHTR
jgi:hypothetical protein